MKAKIVAISTLLAGVMSLASCSSTHLTRSGSYPKLYEEQPVAIAVMPPINNTTHVEAKEYFYTTLAKPLCNKGYYVISPLLAMEIFKNESAYDSEQFLNNSLQPFHDVFGVDAVLFTTIEQWSKSALGGTITVQIEYELKSTHTNETLFKRNGTLTLDLNSTSSGQGLGNLLLDMVSSAVATALTDKTDVARRCNNYVLRDLPEGKYSPYHGTDRDTECSPERFSVRINE